MTIHGSTVHDSITIIILKGNPIKAHAILPIEKTLRSDGFIYFSYGRGGSYSYGTIKTKCLFENTIDMYINDISIRRRINEMDPSSVNTIFGNRPLMITFVQKHLDAHLTSARIIGKTPLLADAVHLQRKTIRIIDFDGQKKIAFPLPVAVSPIFEHCVALSKF